LKSYAEGLGARRSLLLPNGVDLEHFSRPAPEPPPEYAALPGPIAVYVGVLPEWFHFDWVARAARELPSLSFVLIGPDETARQHLGGLPNVHLLGFRPYDQVPAYLQHAHVGLMPFDVQRNPEGVDALNPQKLYAYLASGLPVVSSSWEEIRRLNPPARLCETDHEFVVALRESLVSRPDPRELRAYAARFSWRKRLGELLAVLHPDVEATAH
jgi:glycosyltransferase involved in cell wall biosynthesis